MLAAVNTIKGLCSWKPASLDFLMVTQQTRPWKCSRGVPHVSAQPPWQPLSLMIVAAAATVVLLKRVVVVTKYQGIDR